MDFERKGPLKGPEDGWKTWVTASSPIAETADNLSGQTVDAQFAKTSNELTVED